MAYTTVQRHARAGWESQKGGYWDAFACPGDGAWERKGRRPAHGTFAWDGMLGVWTPCVEGTFSVSGEEGRMGDGVFDSGLDSVRSVTGVRCDSVRCDGDGDEMRQRWG
ncbi:hypothetical protein V497_04268 [Pseudogymnoascus sp. VKM F-4516 (FW-969)]|nr:hypothetical protein V497_04268 [Pseudogymnoascus sp. VKM F-4516 (FW-969)]